MSRRNLRGSTAKLTSTEYLANVKIQTYDPHLCSIGLPRSASKALADACAVRRSWLACRFAMSVCWKWINCPVTRLIGTYNLLEEALFVRLYMISISAAIANSPNAIISRTPKNGSECDQTDSANQKPPAEAKQPTLTHLANLEFTISSTIPMTGRNTSKMNSNHN